MKLRYLVTATFLTGIAFAVQPPPPAQPPAAKPPAAQPSATQPSATQPPAAQPPAAQPPAAQLPAAQPPAAQPPAAQPPAAQASPQQTPANEVVRQVIDSEIKAQDKDHTHWMYRQKTVAPAQTLEVVETPKGNVMRVIARNGQPLTGDEQKKEDQTLAKLATDPSEQQKLQRTQDADSRKFRELFKLLPQALTFTDAGQDGDRTKMTFQPNPAFHPSSREARVFNAMDGQLVFDTRQKRLVEFTGHIKSEVRFGILGHLDPGGSFVVRQQDVGQGHWEVTFLKVNIHGRALFFKTISTQQDLTNDEFKRVADDVNFAKAVDLLKKPAAPTEEKASEK